MGRLPDELVAEIVRVVQSELPPNVRLTVEPNSAWLGVQTPSKGSLTRCLSSPLTSFNRKAAVRQISKSILEHIWSDIKADGDSGRSGFWNLPEDAVKPDVRLEAGQLVLGYASVNGEVLLVFPTVLINA